MSILRTFLPAGVLCFLPAPAAGYTADVGQIAVATPKGTCNTINASDGYARVDVAVDDMIRAEGPRIPAAAAAPHDFRVAFILVTEQGKDATAAEVAKVEAYRTRFNGWFPWATDNRGSVDTTLGVRDCTTQADGGTTTDGGSGTPDGGKPQDGGTATDGGNPADAGVPDAGLGDGGTGDAGTPDAGIADAGLPDGGIPADAGTDCPGHSCDGGGTTDGGTGASAGSGCSCEAGGAGSASQGLVLLLALGLVVCLRRTTALRR